MPSIGIVPRCRIFYVASFSLILSLAASAQTAGTALVTHAPVLNGSVIGSIQQMTAESTTLNGGASVSGDLLVPGTPTIRINGHPSYVGTLDGAGANTPTNYSITLNGNSSLQHVVLRTDPVALQAVAAPPAPKGTRDVAINSSGQSPGDFTTIRNLTLNGNVGSLTVPAGTYGALTANGGSSFVFGVIGNQVPSVYNLQGLTLNGNVQLQVVGPVVINLANGPAINGTVGKPGHAAWLAFNVASGGLTLNGNAALHGYVAAPNGTVIINGSVLLVGGLQAGGLTVNGNGVLQLVVNRPPTVSITAPDPNVVLVAPANVTLSATASDPDGTVAAVAFYNGSSKLGDAQPVSGQPSSYSLTLASPLAAGTYTLTAQATDNLGATTTSSAITLRVDSPPKISITPPTAGTVFASPATIAFTAAVTPGFASIAKIEIYRGGALIATLPAPSTSTITFTDPASLPPGTYTYTARVYDTLGLYTDSAPVTIAVLAGLPYLTDFEAGEGYVLGSLAGQLGWAVPQGSAAVVSDQAYSGQQSALLSAATPPSQLAQTFAPLPSENIVFLDFFAKPVAESNIAASTTIDVGGARFAFSRISSGQGQLQAFSGNSQGGGAWKTTTFTASLAMDGSTQSWERLTARLDFAHQTWDLYANGVMVAADLGFRTAGSTTYLANFTVQGDATAASRLDYLFAGPQNPLFADVNNDGIDDAWETKYGLSLAVNDRYLTPAGNGVTVIQAYVNGTDPNDYYGGVLPVLTSLVTGGQPGPQGLVAVKVTRASDGSPLANAPLTLAVTTGATQLSAVPGGTGSTEISVRSDTQGVAQGYVTFVSSAADTLVATAQSGANSTSISIPLSSPVPPQTLPYTTGFEVSDGVQPGPLSGQQGWTADSGVVVVQGPVGAGGNFVQLPAAATPLNAKIAFAAYTGQTTAVVDFFTQASAGSSVATSVQFSTDSAKFAIVQTSGGGQVYVFMGNGAGGGSWQATGTIVPLNTTNQTDSWVNLTIREDFSAKNWSLYLNGSLIAQNLGLIDNSITSLGYFAASGGTGAPTLLDGFSAGFGGSQFPDYGQEIMAATIAAPANLSAPVVTGSSVTLTWSASNSPVGGIGYIIYRDDQSIGTTTGTTFTDPAVAENTDYTYTVRAFDGVGNFSPFSSPLTVHTPSTIDPANSLPADWELRYYGQTGLDPNAPSGNGDGYTILQEYQLGRDPTDFYNGVVPVQNVLYNGGPGPNGELAMIVQHPDGSPWPNAPVTFYVTTGNRRISAAQGGPIYQYTVQVRADANGLAQVYLEPLSP